MIEIIEDEPHLQQTSAAECHRHWQLAHSFMKSGQHLPRGFFSCTYFDLLREESATNGITEPFWNAHMRGDMM